jgi:hypothetical protein
MSRKTILSNEDIEIIINRYKNGESTREIAKDSKVGKTRINTILNENNVLMKTTGNSYCISTYTLNEHYFDNIDTEEKAYWLGFISADGHVGKDGITIVLQYKDKNHLSKFLEHVNSNSPIKYRKGVNAFVISIYSRHIVDVMRQMKFYRNKSETQTFPDCINKELYKHFIRGVWDGDGSITITKRLKKRYINYTTECKISICGQFAMIKKIKDIIMEYCNANDTKIQLKENGIKGFSVIDWGGRIQCLNILDWLYKDSVIYLDRKYEKYITMKNI